MQIPHHGSRHNVTSTILDRRIGPRKLRGTVVGYAFCSIGANKPDYPCGKLKNAFNRRDYKVYANRTAMISHYSGLGHPRLVPLTPEPYDDQIEAQ